jgi:flagellar hook assembly protein FlgD
LTSYRRVSRTPSKQVIARVTRFGARRVIVAALIAALAAVAAPVSVGAAVLGDAAPARAGAAQLKAVIVVGPTHGSTAGYLAYGESLAKVAESYGMDVRRVFHPKATWANVLANAQGANLFVYMGHGNGWPSPYAPYQERTKNGMGLNRVEGGSTSNVEYYGAKPIREQLTFAPNSLVLLNHLCYAAGNGEPGMAVPSWSVAHQRADNFAAGFLAAGAKGVFAYSWQSVEKIVKSLFTTDMTTEQIFTTPGYSTAAYAGYIGWDPRKLESVRTPGTVNFLDPHSKDGFLRAYSGDLTLTAADWRSGVSGGGVPADPPVLTGLTATPMSSGSTLVATSPAVVSPNADGLSDAVKVSYVVDREAFVDFKVLNSANNVVRQMTNWSAAGPGQGTWDGKKDNGDLVNDGLFKIVATPRDRLGNTGASSSVEVRILTALRAPAATPAHFYAADNDELAPTTTLSVQLDQQADLSWRIVDGSNAVVRTLASHVMTLPGDLRWTWDGRDSDGEFVPDGRYFSVMTATTGQGTQTHRVAVDVGAFRITSALTSAARGEQVKFVIYAAEPGARPKLKVTQPGLATTTWWTTRVAPGKFRVIVNLQSGGSAGTVLLRAVGFDANDQKQFTDGTFQVK